MNNSQKTKENIDVLLERYKAQPVGKGYIDIIVMKENYKQFIDCIIKENCIIKTISWWEYCKTIDTKNRFGFGGPRSRYYSGWFSELSIWDDIETRNIENIYDEIVKIVDHKIIEYPVAGVLNIHDGNRLTPGFWLDVPSEWENIHYQKYLKNN